MRLSAEVKYGPSCLSTHRTKSTLYRSASRRTTGSVPLTQSTLQALLVEEIVFEMAEAEPNYLLTNDRNSIAFLIVLTASPSSPLGPSHDLRLLAHEFKENSTKNSRKPVVAGKALQSWSSSYTNSVADVAMGEAMKAGEILEEASETNVYLPLEDLCNSRGPLQLQYHWKDSVWCVSIHSLQIGLIGN